MELLFPVEYESAGNLLFCKISVITTNGAEIVVEQPKCVAIVIIVAFTL